MERRVGGRFCWTSEFSPQRRLASLLLFPDGAGQSPCAIALHKGDKFVNLSRESTHRPQLRRLLVGQSTSLSKAPPIEDCRATHQPLEGRSKSMQCQRCEGRGKCPTCKGTGRSGYFLLKPQSWAPKCWRCDGTASCNRCKGSGEVADYTPWISVLTSLTRPTSISVAAFTGAAWRFIGIPNQSSSVRMTSREAGSPGASGRTT